MRASRPAAGAAFAVAQVLATPVDPLEPGLGLLRLFDTADPLVAGQGGDRRPGRQGCGVAAQRRPQIGGKGVDDAAGQVCILSHAPFSQPRICAASRVLPTPWGGEVRRPRPPSAWARSEEHTSELQSHVNLVCRLLLEKIFRPAKFCSPSFFTMIVYIVC